MSQEADSRRRAIPTADDFTAEAVSKAVFSESLQHPLTVLPLAAAAVAALYSAAFVTTSGSLLAIIGSGFVGASSWVFNYFIRGDKIAAEHVAKLRQLRSQGEMNRAESLVGDCQKAGFAEGAKEGAELIEAYQNLCLQFAQSQPGKNNLAQQRFSVLAEDTYREGVSILQRAFNTYEALSRVDAESLEMELKQWQHELDNQKEDLQASDREQAALKQKIVASEKLLKLYRDQKDEVEMLIAQTNELETALRSASLALGSLGEGDDGVFETKAGERLEIAVQAARKVEDKLRRGGQEAGDEQYLQAGKYKKGEKES